MKRLLLVTLPLALADCGGGDEPPAYGIHCSTAGANVPNCTQSPAGVAGQTTNAGRAPGGTTTFTGN